MTPRWRTSRGRPRPRWPRRGERRPTVRPTVLHHERHRSHRRGRAAAHLERQAYEEELLARQLVEIAELLDHADPLLQPDLVGGPPPLVGIVHAHPIVPHDPHVPVHPPLPP